MRGITIFQKPSYGEINLMGAGRPMRELSVVLNYYYFFIFLQMIDDE